ncbi:hypothetical protein Goshw_024532 [Gossypium schwendimanii]|uniref:Uncharacterized protein n=1 Tax=Gossypium schwendimanii TaxID=34291 RepID=A0A7J9LC95_GOSSC|nr:hypothetical protein [Gossypium schwendimanii]
MEDSQVKECKNDNNTQEDTQNLKWKNLSKTTKTWNLHLPLLPSTRCRTQLQSLEFSSSLLKGKLFVSAGNDKLVKVWSAESWRCIATVCSEKRASALAIRNDGLHVCLADKFVVVWVVNLSGVGGTRRSS